MHFWNLGSEVPPKSSSSSAEEITSEMKNDNGVLNFHMKVDKNLTSLGENLESVGTGSVSNIGTTGMTFCSIFL